MDPVSHPNWTKPFARRQRQLFNDLAALAEARRLTAEVGDRIKDLSPRELAVLRMVAVGLTMTEIGERFGITPYTVKNHLTRIYEKLGIRRQGDGSGKAARACYVLGRYDRGELP